MRILHVSHQHLKYLGARNYFFPVRINNGFIRNNHEVFWYSDRDVARCSNPLGSRKFGVGASNRKLLEVCRNFQPDVIALSSADIIKADTLIEARRLLPNVAIFQYYIDALFIEHNIRNARSKAEVVDRTFATTAGSVLECLAGTRSKVAFIPNPVDCSIDVNHCHERLDQAHDVFFAGNAHKSMDPDDLRMNAYELIRDQLPHARLAFYGHGQQQSLYGTNFSRALGDAKIGLNFSQRDRTARSGPGGTLYLYSSDRIAMYLGNGLLTFTTRDFSLSEIYGSNALVEVDGRDDFIDKLHYYINRDDERQRVARTGYELAHAEFNERLVAQYMLEATLGLPMSHSYRWPLDTYGPLA